MATELETVSYDTNVVSDMIGLTDLGVRYEELVGSREAALTYFVRGELLAGQRSRAKQLRLDTFYAQAEVLPAPTEELLEHYVLANRMGHALGLGHGVGEDLWMIAQTMQHNLSFVTHDRNAARVATAIGLTVYTLLPDIEADYARDAARLAQQRDRRR